MAAVYAILLTLRALFGVQGHYTSAQINQAQYVNNPGAIVLVDTLEMN